MNEHVTDISFIKPDATLKSVKGMPPQIPGSFDILRIYQANQ